VGTDRCLQLLLDRTKHLWEVKRFDGSYLEVCFGKHIPQRLLIEVHLVSLKEHKTLKAQGAQPSVPS